MLTRLANAHRGAKVHSNASMPCLMAMTSLSSSLSAYNCPQQYSPTTFQSASRCACRHFEAHHADATCKRTPWRKSALQRKHAMLDGHDIALQQFERLQLPATIFSHNFSKRVTVRL